MMTPTEDLIAEAQEFLRMQDCDLFKADRLIRELLALLTAAVPHPQIAQLQQELEQAKGDAIHGWSEVEHQRGHKEEYIEMLAAAEAALRAYGQHTPEAIAAALQAAWEDGFQADHTRYMDSAWRHSLTRIAIEERTHSLLQAAVLGSPRTEQVPLPNVNERGEHVGHCQCAECQAIDAEERWR